MQKCKWTTYLLQWQSIQNENKRWKLLNCINLYAQKVGHVCKLNCIRCDQKTEKGGLSVQVHLKRGLNMLQNAKASRKAHKPREAKIHFLVTWLIWASSWDYGDYRRSAKVQASLCIRAVSPEPSLFAHIKYGRRRRVRPRIGHLAPLDGCVWAFEEWVYGRRKVT